MIPHVGTGQTVAKIILLGEHSVVYGYPAIALPMHSLKMTARVEPVRGGHNEGTLTGLGWSGPISKAPAHFASILRAREVAAEFVGDPDGLLSITTESEFPAQRGLGSSAAAAGAVIRAVLNAYDAKATAHEIFTLTQEAETIAHGQPSGLDAVTTSATSPVHFQAGRTTDLGLPLDAWIVIADSGIHGSTRETVGHVRSLYENSFRETQESLSRLGKIAEGAVDNLRSSDISQLGIKMTESHGILADLGVSTVQLDELVYAALDAGALGGKLTGGGGGGCVIALAHSYEDAQRISDAMREAGARATWTQAPLLNEVVA
ncbi:mevalonate kinase [Ancrocorticia populi]|uniref:mevalonate kinase n=2 Tax=Ancrocorticia populi TaxID=2175228 RepID=UPI003F9A07A2